MFQYISKYFIIPLEGKLINIRIKNLFHIGLKLLYRIFINILLRPFVNINFNKNCVEKL